MLTKTQSDWFQNTVKTASARKHWNFIAKRYDVRDAWRFGSTSIRRRPANFRKHGISFEEAQTVFADPLAFTTPDDAHSEDEEREITIGYSQKLRLLLVVHTEVTHDEIRIISARKADAYEERQYLNT